MITTTEDVKALFTYNGGTLTWRADVKSRKVRGKPITSKTKAGYTHVYYKGKRYLAHNLIYLLHHSYSPEHVYHINDDRSDNRISNLGASTLEQGKHFARLPERNTSGVRGVYWDDSVYMWTVYLKLDGKRKFIGRYIEFEQAVTSAAEARRRHLNTKTTRLHHEQVHHLESR